MITTIALFSLGLFLSAFFSGCETGFYRVTRIRLVLDARGGDRTARMLLWFTNNPALFVATALIGNNLANYLTSLGIVLGAAYLPLSAGVAEIAAPILLSPLVFVYGELLPKNVFFKAPNRLLRRGGPLFLACAFVFAPISALLWALGWVLQRVIGETPLQVQLTLARAELQQVLVEGQDAGILKPAQRRLAQSLFLVASRKVADVSVPITKSHLAQLGDDKKTVLQTAERRDLSIFPVRGDDSLDLVGYVRAVDLLLDDAPTIETVRPLPEVASHEPLIAALIQLQSAKADVARVVGPDGETQGLVFTNDLTPSLVRSE